MCRVVHILYTIREKKKIQGTSQTTHFFEPIPQSQKFKLGDFERTLSFGNPADKILAIDRIAFLDEQTRDLATMGSRDDHFL